MWLSVGDRNLHPGGAQSRSRPTDRGTTVRTSVRGALAAFVALAVILGVVTSASADQHTPFPTKAQVNAAAAAVAKKAGDVASIQAELVAADNRLQIAGDRAGAAAEAYNGAVWELSRAKAATAAAAAAAAAAQAKVTAQRANIAALVVQTYQDGSELNGVTALMGAQSPSDVMNRWGAMDSVSSSMQAHFDAYTALNALAKVAKDRAATALQAQHALTVIAAARRNAAASAAAGAQSEANAIAVQRTKLIAQLAAAQKISVALASQRQTALEQIARQHAAAAARARALAAAKAAAAAAAAAAAHANGGNDSPPPYVPPSYGPTAPIASSAAVARAIAFAKAQLGKPYVWAGAGPDVWDCSGLTMVAWEHGGIYLPHFAAAQYAEITHIGVTDLRPGDLVFWGPTPDTIEHVAMYLGNGMIIQAPHTGAWVDIESMYGWEAPTFFGRP
ncbi:MAG: NlpC/P60 family protein [Marmoricola sp.]|nr:NlpC/P60 family protein [Marmoricola sp.]